MCDLNAYVNECLFICSFAFVWSVFLLSRLRSYVGLLYFLFHLSRLPNPICCVWISVDIHLASCCAPDLNRSAIIIAFKHEIATATAITCFAHLYIRTITLRAHGHRRHILFIYIWALSQYISMDKDKPNRDSHVLIPIEIFVLWLFPHSLSLPSQLLISAVEMNVSLERYTYKIK